MDISWVDWVFYLWRHVLSTAPPFILWWSNLEILFPPLHRSSPYIAGLRCQAIQTEHGPYIAERTQKAVYIVIHMSIVTRYTTYHTLVLTHSILPASKCDRTLKEQDIPTILYYSLSCVHAIELSRNRIKLP
jgi:hypothetical protein